MKVGLVCIAKNEDKYIQEWISYHKKLGFDSIIIYENDWRSNINQDGVITFAFDGPVQQLPAYNHFIQSNSDFGWGYDWAAIIDIDEFIVLKKHKNIKDFIQEYGNIANGIAMHWMLFGNNGHEEIIDDNYSVLERFTKREESINPHVKTLLKLTSGQIRMKDPHIPNVPLAETNGSIVNTSMSPNGSIDVIQLNHYFCKTPKEFNDKIARGRSDMIHKRNFSDYGYHNKNDVDDFLALNFMKQSL
jgi:hypothetical protein